MNFRKYRFCILLLLIIPYTSQAQFLSQKDKYWIYRERLKNFMVRSQGTAEKGRDIPASYRDKSDKLSWSDTPWMIGYWMGTLAMEYQLLRNAGFGSTSPEVMQTKEDLYGAIQSINRLDWEAEESWDDNGCNKCPNSGNIYTPCPENINGFLIADDIPMDFSEVQSIIDGLNEGLVPTRRLHGKMYFFCFYRIFNSRS
jgi:hypothetical protein